MAKNIEELKIYQTWIKKTHVETALSMLPAFFHPKSLQILQVIGLPLIDIADIFFHLLHAFKVFLPAQLPDRVVHHFTAVGSFTTDKEQAGEKDKEQGPDFEGLFHPFHIIFPTIHVCPELEETQ